MGRGRIVRCGVTAAVAVLSLTLAAAPAWADRVKNGTAVFSGLDKITGRIISFKASLGETVQFGSLQVTPRACYTRPAKEAPLTDSFVEIDEVSATRDFKRIFSGWMFAASPGLHGLEHPIYDIWMTGCENPGETIVDAPQTADAEGTAVVPTPAEAVPGAPAPDAAPTPAAPPVADAPKPKPRRVARPTPPRADPGVETAQRAEPRQRFFPTSQYTTDVPVRSTYDAPGRDPASGGGR